MTTAIVARDRSGKWLPGTSGNPGGRRTEAELSEVRRLAREATAEAVETLREIAADRSAQAMARVRAAEALLARGWGVASSEVELDEQGRADDGPAVFIFRMGEEPLEIDAGGDEAEWDDGSSEPPELPTGA